MLKHFCLLSFVFLLNLEADAQFNWGGGRDEETLHYGYLFRGTLSKFSVLRSADWQKANYSEASNRYLTDSLRSVHSNYLTGFGVGLVTNLRLGNNADLRCTPTIFFTDRQIRYEYKGGKSITKTLDYPTVEIPISIKVKSDRRGNFRAYALGGLVFSTDISLRTRELNNPVNPLEVNIRNKPYYWGYEFGLGFDLYLEYFKLSPEIKFLTSMNDVLLHDPTMFANPISKLYVNTIQFGLIFE